MRLKKKDKSEDSGSGSGLWRRTFGRLGSEKRSGSGSPDGRSSTSPSQAMQTPPGRPAQFGTGLPYRLAQQDNFSQGTFNPPPGARGWTQPAPERYWVPPNGYPASASQRDLPYQYDDDGARIGPPLYGPHGLRQGGMQAYDPRPNMPTVYSRYELPEEAADGRQWFQEQGPDGRVYQFAYPRQGPQPTFVLPPGRGRIEYPSTIPRHLQRQSISLDMPGENLFIVDDDPSISDGSSVRAAPRRSSSDDSIHEPLQTDEGLLMINLNEGVLSAEEPPAWYIKEPDEVPRGDPKHLCGTCRHINLDFLYGQKGIDQAPHPDEFIRLGTLSDFLLKFKDCGLCHFLMRLIAVEVTTKRRGPGFTTSEMADEFFGNYLNEPGTQETDYFLYPIQFKEEYNVPGLYICPGPLPAVDTAATRTVVRPDNLHGFRRVHGCCKAPNTGRSIEARETIDVDWIKEQLELCEQRSAGRTFYSRFSPVQIRAIDVHEMRIVDLEDGEDYVTLSYVWGDAKQVRLVWETETLLRMPRGVAAFWDRIPKTIRDAITLTRQIGLDYLWVDALCIIQDDAKDQARQIKHMGHIYQSSILTIQARCGEDASYGLPGVDPGTRNVNQILGLAGKGVVCNMLPDNEFVSSVWETRAWTMQENVLSQRKLIITDQSCTFWCSHTSTTEDMYCRHRYWPEGEQYRQMLFYKADHSSLVRHVRRQSNFDTYAFMVSDYTQRSMKCQADAENAMLGIFDSTAATFEGRYVHGLPDEEIDSALLWCPTGASERRVDERTGRPLFPSWSWLGWIGHACWPWATDRALPLTTRASPLQWRVYGNDGDYSDDSDDGERVAPENGWVSRTKEPPPAGWARSEDDPWVWSARDRVWWNPISSRKIALTRAGEHPHRLELRTLSASFELSGEPVRRAENYNFQHSVYHMHVLDADGFRVGAVSIPDPDAFSPAQKAAFLGGGGVRHEFIALSRASVHHDPSIGLDDLLEEEQQRDWHGASVSHAPSRVRPVHGLDPQATQNLHESGMFDTAKYEETVPYCMFNVLMVERAGAEDVAFRVAVGRIHVDAFLAASPTSKEIFLE